MKRKFTLNIANFLKIIAKEYVNKCNLNFNITCSDCSDYIVESACQY